MRIGIYTPYLDTLTGGEKYILTAASCLAENHEVCLFWDGKEEEIRKKISDKFGMDMSNITFADNIFDKNVSFLKRFFASRAYDRIIVLSDGSIPFVSPKLIIHFQTPMEWVGRVGIKTKIKLLRVYKSICNSEYTKRYIDRKFHITSQLIYPPVVISSVDRVKKENIILHVGRYGIAQAGSSYKKQEVLVDVFKKLCDLKISGWKLVLIVSVLDTDIQSLADLKDEIKEYPIELLVNPTNKALWEMYGKAKIYWHASGFGEDLQLHPDRAEHFGIATVEAMGSGAVPVVINAGGQPEIVEDKVNGMLWNTEEELIEKTKELIDNASLWESLSHAAQKKASVFSRQRFCEAWDEAII